MYEIYCELRDARGMKDADVARETGITKSTFSDWKNGRSNPKDAKLQKIADLFGVSVEFIRTGKEKEGGEKYYLNEKTAETRVFPAFFSDHVKPGWAEEVAH